MKKAIALFITLTLIMVISILVSKSLEISQKSLEPISTIKNLNQISDILSLTTKILSQNLEFVEDASMLDLVFMTYPVESKNLKLNITIEPISNKIDLNYAFKDINTSLEYIEIFDYIFDRYELGNRYLFYDLLYDTMDSDDISKGGFDSEIVNIDRTFENSLIYDKEQFDKILKHYSFLANDQNIYKIPWSEIVYFNRSLDTNSTTKPPIYINFLKDELILAFDISKEEDEYIISDEELSGAIDTQKAQKYNITYYKKGQSFLVLCKIDYSLDTIRGKIEFIYDIGTKKVVSIEKLL